MMGQMSILPACVILFGCAPDRPDRTPQGAPLLDLTLENIYGPRGRAGGSVISPDGRHVAVSATGPEGSGIYLVPTGVEAGGGETSAASDRIVFRRGPDLWTIAVGSTEPVRLTADEHDERAPRVSPDGRLVAFYSGRSGFQDIWVVPADGSGAPTQVTFDAFAPDDFRWSPAWAPDSRRIAYVSNAADYWHDDVWVVDIESMETRQVSRGLMVSTEPAWSPDGTTIALLGTHKDGYWYEDLADIFVLDPAADTERTVEMQIYATDWLHRMRIFWSGDGERIHFPYHERGDFDLWSVPVAGGVATRVTNMGGSLGSISASAGAELFAFTRATPTRGSDVDLIPAAGGPLRRLTHFAAEWTTVVDPVEISFKSYDGLYIQGFLYMPPDHAPGDRHPALVNVHGGGTNSYLHGEGLFEQYLASKGYVVLAVNYRGGSGFGREFQDLGGERLGERAGAGRRGGRRLPADAGLCGREGGNLRLQLRRHHQHGGDHAGAGGLRRGRADGRDLRLRRRVHQRRPSRADLHQDGTLRLPRGAARDLRREQHAGPDREHRHAAADHARRTGRARAVPAVRDRGCGARAPREGLREPELPG